MSVKMLFEQTVIKRVKHLIDESYSLKKGDEDGQVFSNEHEAKCKGWIAAALNIVKTICPDLNNGYHQQAQKIAVVDSGYVINTDVGEIGEILKNLYTDIELGLITNFADKIRAEVFDNFLDHAKEYLKHKMKKESGVIAGVVFEDTIRRLSRKHNIEETGMKLEDIISNLCKLDIISQAKAKRARAAAHVRTKATHAQWEEFDINDVSSAIEFTEEIILKHIDSN